MTIAIIKDKNNDYYINLDEKDNKEYLSCICANNKETRTISEQEYQKLLKDVFQPKLEYITSYKDYEIYQDDTGNKHFFKNQKEDFSLLFSYNGTKAIMYNNNTSKIEKVITYGIMIPCVLAMSTYTIIAYSNVFDKLMYNNNIEYTTEYKTEEITPLTVEEVSNFIKNSTGENLDTEKKEYLYNQEFIEDVLKIADSKRYYSLRKKLNNLSIKYFDEDDIKDNNTSTTGYYNSIDPNTIHLLNDTEEVFNFAASHEFAHLMQDNNKYHYIREACAELIKEEYYNIDKESYLEEIKRVYILMELIGPKAIMECNFKGSTESFENEIYKNLNEEDAKKLLSLFKKHPGYENNEEMNSINKEIDVLLAKMYYNINQNDIKDDELIDAIYNNSITKRIYFNQHKEEFYKTRKVNIDYGPETLDLDDVINSNAIKKYIYTERTEITKKDYDNFEGEENTIIYTDYDKHPTYNKEIHFNRDNHKLMSVTSNNKTYTVDEAIEKNIIQPIYVKSKTYEENNYEDISKYINGTQKIIEVVFNDNSTGFIINNKEIIKRGSSSTITIPSIAEKFPEQVNNKTTINTDQIIEMLENENEINNNIYTPQNYKSK